MEASREETGRVSDATQAGMHWSALTLCIDGQPIDARASEKLYTYIAGSRPVHFAARNASDEQHRVALDRSQAAEDEMVRRVCLAWSIAASRVLGTTRRVGFRAPDGSEMEDLDGVDMGGLGDSIRGPFCPVGYEGLPPRIVQ